MGPHILDGARLPGSPSVLPGVTTGRCGARPRGRQVQGFTGVQGCFFNVDWGGWTWPPESVLPPLVHMWAPTFYIKTAPDCPVPLPCCQKSRLAAVEPDQEADKGLPVFRFVFNVDWGGGHGRPSRCCRPLCTCGPPHSTLKRRPTSRFPFRAARSHDWLLWSQTKRPTRVYRCSGIHYSGLGGVLNVDWGGVDMAA